MKLNKVITMLRDENIDLRERIIDVETDYVTLNDSYRSFITVSATICGWKLLEIRKKEIIKTRWSQVL